MPPDLLVRFLLLVYIKHDFLVLRCQHLSEEIACNVTVSLLCLIDESLFTLLEKRQSNLLFFIKLTPSFRLLVND